MYVCKGERERVCVREKGREVPDVSMCMCVKLFFLSGPAFTLPSTLLVVGPLVEEIFLPLPLVHES